MGYTGRLIRPMLCEILQLDRQATRTAGAYDDRFRAPRVSYPAGPEGPRARGQKFKDAPVRVRAQVENVSTYQQAQAATGNLPKYKLMLICKREDLIADGLVDIPSRAPSFGQGDTLKAYYTLDGELQREFTSEPMLVITEVRDGGGFVGGFHNLVFLCFDDRQQGVAG